MKLPAIEATEINVSLDSRHALLIPFPARAAASEFVNRGNVSPVRG
jgi:hypothetical protein